MGRRPHAIVAEFFERGAKLDDSSNRYQHTCRRCGELFPKGRVDNLQNHLLKRCPNVTQDDRKLIAVHLQQIAQTKKDDASKLQPVVNTGKANSHAVGFQATLERQQSALDTLAEVSRRHLDYSSQRDAGFDQQVFLQDADQALAEQALWAQLQQHNMNMSTSQPTADNFDMQLSREFEQDQSMHDLGPQTFSSAEFVPTAVQTTNDTMQLHANDMGLGSLDPDLAVPVSQSFDASIGQLLATENARHDEHAAMSTSRAHNLRWANTTVPVDTFTASTVSKGTKQRGRFTESRRKQVQEIRKQGACIRCRMLKKPCSEGTPCKTCANIDTARLWTGGCLRTRLVDEFTAWSSGYFQALSRLSTTEVTTEAYARRVPDCIHVRLGVDKGPSLVLNAKQYTSHGANGNGPGPRMPTLNAVSRGTLILEESDDLAEKLTAYCMSESILQCAIEAEPHHFVRTTLQQAQQLVRLELEQQQLNNGDGKSETRACYSVANSLTKDTLTLWLLTSCLTAGTASSRSFFFDISLGATDDILSITASEKDIIRLQLLAALENQASRLSKKVLNDTERRLLQRQQVSGFATFIAAVVLTNSVERMTGYYQSLDDLTMIPADWPIDNPPHSYWTQGQSFANLLTALLRVRGLPPRTYEDEHGRLAVIYESSEGVRKINGTASEAHLRTLDEERRTALSAWLDDCSVNAAEVRSWVDGTSADWYGKFLASLLIQ